MRFPSPAKMAFKYFLIVCGLGVFSSGARAELARVLVVNSNSKIEVRGWSANLNLVFNPNMKSLKLTGVPEEKSDSAWSLSYVGNVIRIQGPEAAIAKKLAAKTIQIEGPSVPVMVALHDGNVNLNSWTASAKLVLAQGKLNVNKQSGPLNVSMQKGDLSVAGLSSSAKLDLYDVNASLKDVDADLEWNQHAGSAVIEKHAGNISFNSYSGNFKSVAGQGTLNFDATKGSVAVYQFSGRVDGNAQEASANLQLLAESEISVKSTSGRISIQTPAASGALLNLSAEDGDILVPSDVNIRKNGVEKSVKARMKGASQKLSVFARTQTGSIQIK